jgi:hypothetical protein
METKLVQQALNEFGAMVVQRAQANLKKGGKFGTYNASGNLSRSLNFKTKVNPNSLEFDFFAESYWKFLDYGTKEVNRVGRHRTHLIRRQRQPLQSTSG